MRTGRPKIDEKIKKTKLIKVRVSHEQREIVKNLAERQGVSVSDLVRGLIDEIDSDEVVAKLSKDKPMRSETMRSDAITAQ